MTAPAFPVVQGEEGVTVGEVFVVNMPLKHIAPASHAAFFDSGVPCVSWLKGNEQVATSNQAWIEN